jgi:hypothetical protein
MSENKTGKANRVKGKNVHGRVVVLTRSKPEQLALFQTFLPDNGPDKNQAAIAPYVLSSS